MQIKIWLGLGQAILPSISAQKTKVLVHFSKSRNSPRHQILPFLERGSLGLTCEISRMKKRQVVIRKQTSQRISGSQIVRNPVRYAECQKNHAANIGGYAVDGCREFMAGGQEGTAAALGCAACGCHRSFHRREGDAEVVGDNSSVS